LSSRRLGILDGPLRFGVNDHDIDRFVGLRIKSIFQENFGTEDYLTQKAGGLVSWHWHWQNCNDLSLLETVVP
jgi:hypothetical protein